jgi:CRISPR/Cas system CMR-associated protein Cmr5 small subunit
MQIPKQPRTKSSAGATAAPTDNPASDQNTPAPSTVEDVNKQLQQAYSSYVEKISSANLNAQLAQARAYLTYLETLQHRAGSGPDPTLEYWNEILRVPDDATACADAHKKFAIASYEKEAIDQKTLADAATTYSQTTREIWDKLQSDVGQHNAEIADSLKNALLKADVNTANIPALSMLYQGLRTMSAKPTSDAAKTV